MTTHDLPKGMVTAATRPNELQYMPGFGNDFETEALPGALPQGMNSPQKCNYGLYGEQLSGTAFTANPPERTWCYRIRPSVKHSSRYAKIDVPFWKSAPNVLPDVTSLGQYRWDPVPHSDVPLNWITGMRTMTTAGDVNTQVGMAAHIYLVTESMKYEYFFSADSELLVVPQEGRLRFATELGMESWAEYFLRWVLSHEAVDVAITGTGNPRHIEQNLRIATLPVLDAATRKRMAEFVRAL